MALFRLAIVFAPFIAFIIFENYIPSSLRIIIGIVAFSLMIYLLHKLIIKY